MDMVDLTVFRYPIRWAMGQPCPALSFINVGYVVDDRVFIRTGVVDNKILLRSEKAWRPS